MCSSVRCALCVVRVLETNNRPTRSTTEPALSCPMACLFMLACLHVSQIDRVQCAYIINTHTHTYFSYIYMCAGCAPFPAVLPGPRSSGRHPPPPVQASHAAVRRGEADHVDPQPPRARARTVLRPVLPGTLYVCLSSDPLLPFALPMYLPFLLRERCVVLLVLLVLQRRCRSARKGLAG